MSLDPSAPWPGGPPGPPPGPPPQFAYTQQPAYAQYPGAYATLPAGYNPGYQHQGYQAPLQYSGGAVLPPTLPIVASPATHNVDTERSIEVAPQQSAPGPIAPYMDAMVNMMHSMEQRLEQNFRQQLEFQLYGQPEPEVTPAPAVRPAVDAPQVVAPRQHNRALPPYKAGKPAYG